MEPNDQNPPAIRLKNRTEQKKNTFASPHLAQFRNFALIGVVCIFHHIDLKSSSESMGIQHIIYLYFTQEVYVRRNKGERLHKPASTRVLPIIRCRWDFRNGWNGVRIQSEIFTISNLFSTLDLLKMLGTQG